jgi:acyl-coenzyme A thioesterase PaaI-like protein
VAANEDIVRQAIVGSPLASLLGAETVEVASDCVRVRLPFRAELTTVGELVHGGRSPR